MTFRRHMSMSATICRIRPLQRKVSYTDEMSSGEVFVPLMSIYLVQVFVPIYDTFPLMSIYLVQELSIDCKGVQQLSCPQPSEQPEVGYSIVLPRGYTRFFPHFILKGVQPRGYTCFYLIFKKYYSWRLYSVVFVFLKNSIADRLYPVF